MLANINVGLGDDPIFGVKSNVESIIMDMAKNGISVAAIHPIGLNTIIKPSKANRSLERIGDKNFIRIAVINPLFESEAIDEMIRVRNIGFRGILLRPTHQGYPANHEIVYSVLETSGKLKIPVFIESRYPYNSLPFQIGDLAYEFPNVMIVMVHMGFNDYCWVDAIEVAKKRDNVILETSLMPAEMAIEKAVKEVGDERIIFGSCFPYSNTHIELLKIDLCEIGKEAKEKILYDNFIELFR